MSFGFLNLALLLTLFISISAHGADIIPGEVLTLQDVSDDTKAAAKVINNICSSYGVLQFEAKNRCQGAWKESLFSKTAVQLCEKDLAHSAACLDAVTDKSFPDSVLKLCSLYLDTVTPDRSACLKYFAASQSFYDSEAAKFCGETTGFKMKDSKVCFNQIRDREVDLSKLKECKGKGSGLGTRSESFSDCVERVTLEAPLRKDILCSRNTGGALPRTKDPISGTR